jgi:glycerophosphoryl diester phosphodiesterase
MTAAFARLPGRRPFVYGHRGTRRPGVTENTLGAMLVALAQGADGVELDVRLCRSGEVIVLHDRDLLRVAGAALAAADASLSELREIDLGGGERVPTLDEAMDLVLGRERLLNVELKADVPAPDLLVRGVVERVAARPAAQRARVIFSSFGASVCSLLSAALPEVPVAFLFDREASPALPAGARAVHPRYTLIDPGAVARFHMQKLLVNTWTVNDAAAARAAAEAGVDGIVTDDVPRILDALGE